MELSKHLLKPKTTKEPVRIDGVPQGEIAISPWVAVVRVPPAQAKSNQDEIPRSGISGRPDSNWRPLAPHASALPGCATPRRRFES